MKTPSKARVSCDEKSWKPVFCYAILEGTKRDKQEAEHMTFFQREKTINRVVLLPIDEIVPNPAQPRRDFNAAELQELADSIRENGLLQPITVRKNSLSSTAVSISGLKYCLVRKPTSSPVIWMISARIAKMRRIGERTESSLGSVV